MRQQPLLGSSEGDSSSRALPACHPRESVLLHPRAGMSISLQLPKARPAPKASQKCQLLSSQEPGGQRCMLQGQPGLETFCSMPAHLPSTLNETVTLLLFLNSCYEFVFNFSCYSKSTADWET